MKKQIKSIAAGVMLVGAMGAASQAQATLLIDDFTMVQNVTDVGGDAAATSSTVAPLSGTQLLNASRTVSALATGDEFEQEDVKIGGSFLRINNSVLSSGTAFLDYSFDTTDFTTSGSAILLKVIAIDLGVSVNFSINNGAASSGFQSFAGTGDFFKNYLDFAGDTSQFRSVNNIRLDFQGAPAWDGRFQLLTSGGPLNQVPEPATLGLIGLGLAGLGYRKKKQG